MAANKNPIVIGLAGLVFPGMGQFLNGQKLQGLLFFFLANLLFLSGLGLILIKLYRANQAVPAGLEHRLQFIVQYIMDSGLGALLAIGIIYLLLLLGAAGAAFGSARKNRQEPDIL